MSDPNIEIKNNNRNWKRDVLPSIKQELKEFYKAGFKPTLRTMFYILTSRKIIDNTQGDYSYLSEFTAKCRKRYVILVRFCKGEGLNNLGNLGDETFEILDSHQLLVQYKKSRHKSLTTNTTIIYDSEGNVFAINNPLIIRYDKGGYFESKIKKYILKTDEILPIDCFSDETRGIIDKFIDEYKTPEEHIKEELDLLDVLPRDYKKLIPKWHNQKYHVELWTEKNAMMGTFYSMLKDLDVRIVYNRGFDSVGHAWETYQRFKKIWSKGKRIRILYCGDLDPSGDAMDETINDFMKICFNVEEYKKKGYYDFKRIGVLYEHIDKFELPKIKDPKIIAKLLGDENKKGDPRTGKFIKKYNELFQVEIDAMVAFARDAFKDMIIDNIKIYYDELIYHNLLSDKKHSDGQISLHVMKNVQMFLEQFNIKLMWKWLES
jgi:hypothetical protein